VCLCCDVAVFYSLFLPYLLFCLFVCLFVCLLVSCAWVYAGVVLMLCWFGREGGERKGRRGASGMVDMRN